MLKKILDFFLSLKTSIWILWVFIVFLFAGAFIMPAKKEFQTINSVPLFQWMVEQPLSVTWWLWGSIGLLILLTLNTLFCSIESLIKKRKATQWLFLISPQIIHIGFLFILLAHLLSSLASFKTYVAADEGALLKMPNGALIAVKNINISIDRMGYITDWAVDVEYHKDSILMSGKIIANKPFLKDGFGVNVKDLQAYPFKAVLLEISRELGAVWALIGGILFMVGTIVLIYLRMKQSQ